MLVKTCCISLNRAQHFPVSLTKCPIYLCNRSPIIASTINPRLKKICCFQLNELITPPHMQGNVAPELII